jgi:lactoylglutathione lyase
MKRNKYGSRTNNQMKIGPGWYQISLIQMERWWHEMKAKIALVTIVTEDVPTLSKFYCEVLGFQRKADLGRYVEFESETVRFAVCSREVMVEATGHRSYGIQRKGQSFELAFPLNTPEEVDKVFSEIVAKGATPIRGPATMPWGQRAAFFADPDGNIHELFAYLTRPA